MTMPAGRAVRGEETCWVLQLAEVRVVPASHRTSFLEDKIPLASEMLRKNRGQT